jgi:hypothetical protein
MVRDNFAVLVGTAAVLFIPWGVLEALGRTSHLFATLGGLYLLLVSVIYQAAITIAVSNLYLDRPVTVEIAYNATRPILLPMIGTYLLFYLLLILATIALILPAIYFGVCWCFLAPVMIVERRFGMTALSRSRALVLGNWWYTFGMVLAIGIISQVPVAAVSVLWSTVPFFGPILSAAVDSVTGAFGAAALTIYYFDRRCRVEDFDLIFLAEQIRAEIAAPPTSPQSGSPSVA